MIEHVTKVSCDRCMHAEYVPYEPKFVALPGRWSTVTVESANGPLSCSTLCASCAKEVQKWLRPIAADAEAIEKK